MVIDTSALIAILLKETEAEKFAKAILHDSKRLLSAFSALASVGWVDSLHPPFYMFL